VGPYPNRVESSMYSTTRAIIILANIHLKNPLKCIFLINKADNININPFIMNKKSPKVKIVMGNSSKIKIG
jgi:hypothetical protein